MIEWKGMIAAQTALSSVQRVEWMKYCYYQISNIVIIKCQTLLARGLNISNIVVIKFDISRVGFPMPPIAFCPCTCKVTLVALVWF